MIGKYRGRSARWYLGIPTYAWNICILAPCARLVERCRAFQYRQFKAQHGEDKILTRLFPGRSGFCVEVGANDGVLGSNTFYFEKIGWKGLLIEPDPAVASECRRRRPGFQTVHAAVVAPDMPPEVSFYVTADTTRSSLGFDAPAQAHVPKLFTVHPITVPARTLDSILEEARPSTVTFITIDVEGHEWDVLQGFSIRRWKPEVVIVERNAPEIDARILRYMAENGYRYWRTTPPGAIDGNDWFVPAASPLSMARAA